MLKIHGVEEEVPGLLCGIDIESTVMDSPSRFPQRDPINTYGSFSNDEVQVEWRLRSDCSFGCGSLALGFETRQNNVFFSVFIYRASRIPQETISTTCEGVNGFANDKLSSSKRKMTFEVQVLIKMTIGCHKFFSTSQISGSNFQVNPLAYIEKECGCIRNGILSE